MAAPCPHCGYILDAAVSVKAKADVPIPGSWGMCIECLGFFIFTADPGTLREPTGADYAKLSPTDRKLLRRMANTAAKVKFEKRMEEFFRHAPAPPPNTLN